MNEMNSQVDTMQRNANEIRPYTFEINPFCLHLVSSEALDAAISLFLLGSTFPCAFHPPTRDDNNPKENSNLAKLNVVDSIDKNAISMSANAIFQRANANTRLANKLLLNANKRVANANKRKRQRRCILQTGFTCAKCGVGATPQWRMLDDKIVCNACGLSKYQKKRKQMVSECKQTVSECKQTAIS